MSISGNAPIKAAIYARCSDIKQAEKDLSIPAQLDAARAEAKKRGWEVVAEFIDSAQTGKNDDREQLQAMLRLAKTKKPPPFQRIIVWKFSRFMRNRFHSAIHKTMLRKVGVVICSLHEPTEDTASGRLMEGIIESFDEYYSENLAEDTSRGMRKNASLGFHNGGTTPTGYRVKRTGSEEAPKGVLEPDPETAPLVKRMFRAVLDGEGAASICRALNTDGLKTARGQPWSKTTVLNILRNEVYTGVRIFGAKTERRKDGELLDPVRVESAHPAIVSVEDFRAVQALIAGRTRERIHPSILHGNYLLSGLLLCSTCGSALIGHPAKSGAVHYYWCGRRMKCGPEACDGKLLNQQAAEAAVAERLRDVVLTEAHLTSLFEMTNAEILARGSAVEGDAAAVDAKLEDARKRLERLYASLETGALDVEVLAPRIKQWRATMVQLEEKRAELAAVAGDGPLVIDQATIRTHVIEMRRLLDHGSVAARRAFLRAWVKRIEVRERTLSIEYTFPAWPPNGIDLTTAGGEVDVGKAPRARADAGKRRVNSPSGPSTGRSGPKPGSVLSADEYGSRCSKGSEPLPPTRPPWSAYIWSFIGRPSETAPGWRSTPERASSDLIKQPPHRNCIASSVRLPPLEPEILGIRSSGEREARRAPATPLPVVCLRRVAYGGMSSVPSRRRWR